MELGISVVLLGSNPIRKLELGGIVFINILIKGMNKKLQGNGYLLSTYFVIFFIYIFRISVM